MTDEIYYTRAVAVLIVVPGRNKDKNDTYTDTVYFTLCYLYSYSLCWISAARVSVQRILQLVTSLLNSGQMSPVRERAAEQGSNPNWGGEETKPS